MFLFSNGYTAVLLLISTQSFVGAYFEDEVLDKAIIGFMQVPRIHPADSVIRASETSCAEEIEAMRNAITALEMWALQSTATISVNFRKITLFCGSYILGIIEERYDVWYIDIQLQFTRKKRKKKAKIVADASSKIQSGILKGNIRDLGMYEECIEANGQYNGTYVQGQYCRVSFGLISSAVCLPSSCNETEVAEIVNSAIQNVSVIIGSDLMEVSGVSCVRVDSENFTTAEILTILFFSVVGAFIIFCTVCEFVKKCRRAPVPPALNELAKFSLYTNAMAMLSTEVSPQMMPAVQGIRFLSMCWVVLGHRYANLAFSPIINTFDILEWFSSWPALYILVAPFAVDTFFVISGFLMVYLFLKSKQQGKSSNFPMMYIHRYLRLTPCLAVLMLFVTVLLHRFANGPVWNTSIALQVDPCRRNWWVNLLYVQNFVRKTDMCLAHTWYLAVDMQLFWISPIILYPLHRWPKYGLGILGLCLVASVVVPTVILAINEYSSAIIRFDVPMDEIMDNFFQYYIPTYTRACAYFVGMLLGYEVANNKRHLTKWNVTINWIVTCIFMLVCGLATKRVWDVTLGYNLGLEIAFAILLRPFWSIAIAWIVYACTQGYGGPVTRFLSLPIFLPLSRLSYCIYLVHMVIQVAKNSATQIPFRFADFILFNDFWSDLVLSTVVAFIFSLFFESPVIVLEKMLTNRGRQRSPVRESQNNVEGGIDNKGMTET